MQPDSVTRTEPAAKNQNIGPISVGKGIPTFGTLTFEEAVRLFQRWGFRVEPGPRPEEVTLILEEPGSRTVAVYDAQMIPQIAATALRVRWQNGALSRQAYGHGGCWCEAGSVPVILPEPLFAKGNRE